MEDTSLLQQQQQTKCPRCESTNTKFCYYNNYNMSQPRHFCKNCRRYWTKGGSLRNIPVGGVSRKNSKRPSSTSADSSSSSSNPAKRSRKPEPDSAAEYPNPTVEVAAEDTMLDISGTFSSLLQSSGQFGNLLDGWGSGANPDPIADPNPQKQQGESLLCWAGGWPDLVGKNDFF